MEAAFDLRVFVARHGVVAQVSEGSLVATCAAEEPLRLLSVGAPGKTGGVDWESARFIVVDVVGSQDWSLVFQFEFWDGERQEDPPPLTVRMSVLPYLPTRLVLPLQALDAQHIFLPRTPGKLRSFVHGRRVESSAITGFAFGVREGWAPQRLEIRSAWATDVEPPYPVPAVPLVDEMGQGAHREWAGRTASVEEMAMSLQEEAARASHAAFPEGWSRFGGWRARRMEPRGFFSVQNDGRRWWLVDPEGSPFFMSGMDCVHPGEPGPVNGNESLHTWIPPRDGEFAAAWQDVEWFPQGKDREQLSFAVCNLVRAFGADWEREWARLTRARLLGWGFNTIGGWSSEEFIRQAGMPYVLPMHGFPETHVRLYRDFPDVFSPEYHAAADRYAVQLVPRAQDVNLIGYFLRNEPEWAFSEDVELAEEVLDSDSASVTRGRLIAFLSERHGGSIGELNRAWGTAFRSFSDLERRVPRARSLSAEAARDLNAFSRLMIDQYVRVPSSAVKRVDPHHLNLGMRYAFILYENQLAGKDCFDVFSINLYKIDPSAAVRRTAELIRMPLMIGEFHFGALDSGPQATGIIGVASQRERGRAYRYYLESAAAISECVGVHYFQLNDQPTLGRPDGENYQIGFVDVCHRPYAEIVAGAMEAHARMYEVADGRLPPTAVQPVKITANIAS
jgi:hypothetical protein